MRTRHLARLAAVGTMGAVSVFGALGAANALPGAAQDVASNVLAPLGIDVGNPNADAEPHPDVRGQSGNPDDTSSADVDAPAPASGTEDPSRTEALTGAADHVNSTASGVLNTLTTGTPGPGLGSSVADAASGGHDQVPPSVPVAEPPAESHSQADAHVPTTVPPQKP